MLTVAELIAALSAYPKDAFVYAYEGEVTGVVIVDRDHTEIGYIEARES
jgi:hypothetical protein